MVKRGVLLLTASVAALAVVFAVILKKPGFHDGEAGVAQIYPASPVKAAVATVSLEEVILALRGWDQIVSLPRTSQDNRLIRTIKPAPKAYTSFSDTGEINFEGLLSSHPNVILTWAGNTQMIARLRQLGFRTETVHARNFDDIDVILQQVGDVLQRTAESARIRKAVQQLLERIGSETARYGTVKVLWLGGTRTLVYGKKWIFHDIIEKAGGVDVTADLSFEPWVAELSVEQIIQMNPDVIIIGGWAPYSPEDILRDPQWAPVAAVQNARVHKTPDKRANFSPYAALMAVMTAHWCHPDTITASEALQLLDTYHTKFYGIDFRSVHPEFVKEFAK